MFFRVPEPLVNIGQFLKQITVSPTVWLTKQSRFPLRASPQGQIPLIT